MPAISVIVPVYKVEKYLDRCIESILNQTFKDFEVILVDDGSPDRCPAMCDEWAKKDSRIRVIHKENGGLSSARNTGLKEVKGNYISFIDSDDWIEENMLEVLYRLLNSYPDTDIAQCGLMQDNGRSVLKKASPQIQVKDKTDMWESFFRIRGEASNTSVCVNLYRKDILDGFSFPITLNEDVEASYEFCLRAKKMVVTNQIMYHYFYNDQSITHSPFTRKDMDYFDVWDRIVLRTKMENPNYLKYAQMGRMRADFTMLCKMTVRGYDKNDRDLCLLKSNLKKKVRSNFFPLMKIKMPFSRKIALLIVCII